MNIVRNIIILAASLLVGCEIGYRKHSNSVTWVHWNEGTGRVSEPLAMESPSEFRELGKYYGRAGELVFYKANIIVDADVATFEVLSNTYSKDRKYVFFQGRMINDAEATSFRAIATNYGVDEKAVFYRSFRIVGADPLNFEIQEFESSSAYSCYSVADFFGCSKEYERENT